MSEIYMQVHSAAEDPGTAWTKDARPAIEAPPDPETTEAPDPAPEARWPASAPRTGIRGAVAPNVVALPEGGYRLYYTQILPRPGFPRRRQRLRQLDHADPQCALGRCPELDPGAGVCASDPRKEAPASSASYRRRWCPCPVAADSCACTTNVFPDPQDGTRHPAQRDFRGRRPALENGRRGAPGKIRGKLQRSPAPLSGRRPLPPLLQSARGRDHQRPVAGRRPYLQSGARGARRDPVLSSIQLTALRPGGSAHPGRRIPDVLLGLQCAQPGPGSQRRL